MRLFTFALLLALLTATACSSSVNIDSRQAKKVCGHYVYEHSWSYSVKEGTLCCSETGTMDFYANGSALDSAEQHYTLRFATGDCVHWTYNYVSPSRWKIDSGKFLFAGDSSTFRMTLLHGQADFDCDSAWVVAYAQQIIRNVHSTIGRETAFHLAHLDRKQLVWNLTYRDGHTDTWLFRRK